jgi:hypothetical protein
LQSSFSKYGTYLLSQAFPEGSPTHPSYPTGHGVVAGACVTILKFFFDGNFVIPNPLVPADDGLSLVPYTGSDGGQLTVNGELNKLAHNVTFGHGIHAGIHWRSDSDVSMVLGEAAAISFLQDQAETFREVRVRPSSTEKRPPSLMTLAGGAVKFSQAALVPSSLLGKTDSWGFKSETGTFPRHNVVFHL